MKKLHTLTLVLCACTLGAIAQTVTHHDYITHYNASLKEPDSVSWNLTPAMVTCTKVTRVDMFAPDPLIPGCAMPDDYAETHYDKGHLFNYEDAECDSADRIECFYMSNMLPQTHSFNAGDWKTLETQERVWAKAGTIHIIAGGIGSLGQLPSGENIPAFMWKAIYMNGTWTAWIMPNQKTSVKHHFDYWEKSISELDSQTGLTL